MKIFEKYFLRLEEMLKEVETAESDNIEKAAKLLAEATLAKRSIFAFGCNHAGLITLETFYRTGGLVTVNPVRAPGMMLEISQGTRTSREALSTISRAMRTPCSTALSVPPAS